MSDFLGEGRIMVRRLVILLAFLLAGCNLAVPEVTPTLAPTRTPSPTPFATNTPIPTVVALALSDTPTASSTPTSTATNTPAPTDTVTATPSSTNTPTATATGTSSTTPTASHTPSSTSTFTNTPTATNTNAPTATASFTPRPTDTPAPTATNTLIPSPTPLPIIPTNTPTNTVTPSATPTNPPTATPTFTPTLTLTPSNTPPPSATPTRTLSPDELDVFNTPNAGFPTATPQLPTLPPPTLDVTPTFITQESPSIDLGIVTPLPAETTPQGVPTQTPTPQPTVALIVTLAPTLAEAPLPPTLIPFQQGSPQTLSFAISANGAVTAFTLLEDTTLFERNPVNPGEYVTTDSNGNLYITGVNGSGAYRPDMSPFSQFPALTRDENTAFVSAARWSPNGQYVVFIVAGRKIANDGVWIFQPGQSPPVQLLVDCPSEGFPGCTIVSNPFDPFLWSSRELRWAPGSDAILVSASLPGEGRPGLIVLPVSFNERARDTRPPVFRYDYGDWSNDGARILVSGRGPDGHVYVGWINRDGSFSELVYDAEANGLWMGFGHQARNGQIYALGAPGDRGGPREALRIYDMNGQALTGIIGEGFPQRVEWSPNGTAVFVQVGGRQFIANVNGNVQEISGQVSAGRAVNWVDGDPPPGQPAPSSGIAPVGATLAPAIPSGVIAGSEYQPGQQLRVLPTELNIRSGPGVAYNFVRNFLTSGEYVAILAGPVDADGVRWWQVQTADGFIGWVAGQINGFATLGNF